MHGSASEAMSDEVLLHRSCVSTSLHVPGGNDGSGTGSGSGAGPVEHVQWQSIIGIAEIVEQGIPPAKYCVHLALSASTHPEVATQVGVVPAQLPVAVQAIATRPWSE